MINKNIEVRKAKLEDAKKIFHLAKSLRINFDNPQKNGFLVYVLDEENYKTRIEKSMVDFVLEQDEHHVFRDQIEINSNYSTRGLGKLIMNKLFEEMRNRKINTMYVGILHKPAKNVASFNFCKKLGFNIITEIRNKDNLVWGIYKLEMK